jgi:hypothetical protein
MSEPQSQDSGPGRLLRVWALVTMVALVALSGAALSASWSVQLVLPIAVIIAAAIYLFLDTATPLGRM